MLKSRCVYRRLVLPLSVLLLATASASAVPVASSTFDTGPES